MENIKIYPAIIVEGKLGQGLLKVLNETIEVAKATKCEYILLFNGLYYRISENSQLDTLVKQHSHKATH